ncbi:keratin, type I cytoskeletal 18-like protein [Lates japonicus]|uniref:Keratin, type I cytoskeletal 18-like protein n=1 Tax=Lates japonicus TaxID=270547 RepID=A0AAD3NIQ9_LATJO|nr:keratin, type I cytoskeletal 18-like protein [Lates japonicus]
MEPLFKRQTSQNYGYHLEDIHRPLQMHRAYAHSVSGGAGGHGTRISTVTYGTRVSSGFGGGYDYQSSGSTSGTLGIANEKLTMQHLNRPSGQLPGDCQESGEGQQQAGDIKIREAIEKRGPLEGRDYVKHNAIIAELRAKKAAAWRPPSVTRDALQHGGGEHNKIILRLQEELTQIRTTSNITQESTAPKLNTQGENWRPRISESTGDC